MLLSMSVPEYSSLPQQEKCEIVEEVANGSCDQTEKELLVNTTKREVESGSFYPLGEPVSSVRCDNCCQTINLKNTCAAIKRFQCDDETADVDGVDQAPEIICQSCSDNPNRLANPGEVGVLVRGVLERRRTRPGDDSDAPYLLYVTRTDAADVRIVRPDEADSPSGWAAFK